MILTAEYRGVRSEVTQYTINRGKPGEKVETMNIHTLYLESDDPSITEAISLRVDDAQAAQFAVCTKGDHVRIDLRLRYVENKEAKIRGMLISGVKLIALNNHAVKSVQAAAPNPVLPDDEISMPADE